MTMEFPGNSMAVFQEGPQEIFHKDYPEDFLTPNPRNISRVGAPASGADGSNAGGGLVGMKRRRMAPDLHNQ